MYTPLLRPPEGVFLYMTPGVKYLARAVNELTGRRLNRMLYRWQLRRFLRDPRDKDTVVPMLYQHWITSWPAFRDLVGRLLPQVIRNRMPANMARLRAYRGRVRIIFGARDPYLNLHVAQRLHRLFPNSDLFLLPRGWHYVQIDEPREVAQLVLEMRADALPDLEARHRSLNAGGGTSRPANPLRRWLLRVPSREIDPDVRGFAPCPPEVRRRIVEYFEAFLAGYHAAGETRDLDGIARRLDNAIPPELRGFAYEGAGMALAILDHLTPWNRTRVREFVSGPARPFAVITMIGEGLALARLPWLRGNVRRAIRTYDRVWIWFVVDGFGFHEGFFHHHERLLERRLPPGVDGYAARAFDRGLGRALWFVAGGDPDRIAEIAGAFEASRQRDLWSGVGLACAYAGGIHEDVRRYADVVDAIARHGVRYRLELGLGALLAGATRDRADEESPWTALACERLAGVTWREAGLLAQRIERELRDRFAQRARSEAPEDGFEMARDALMKHIDARLAVAGMAVGADLAALGFGEQSP